MKKSKLKQKIGDDDKHQIDPKWTWHSLVHRLCEKLNYNPQMVYELNFLDAFNWLSYFKEHDEYVVKEKERQAGKKTF